MAKDEEIRRGLAQLAAQHGPAATMIATVQSVDEDSLTCVLTDDLTGQEIPDVQLRPTLDGNKSLTLFPKIGSKAVAVRLEGGLEWMLIAAGQLDKWQLNIAQTTLEQSASGLLVQNGSDKLSDALNLIIDAVMQIVVIEGQNPDFVKLQEAKQKIQNILQ